MDLVLVRHGRSVGNVAIEEAKAHKPLPDAQHQNSSRKWLLSVDGERQAKVTGAWLRDHGLGNFDRHYCSPYVRTMQTAALLDIPDASWWVEPLLRERDRGYEYVAAKDELAEAFPHSVRTKAHDVFLWRPTGGESIPDVDLRMREMLATMARELPGKRVICVTHEDAMDALRFRLEKMTISEWIRRSEEGAEPIVNGGILHYTRRDPHDAAKVLARFGWVRLTDPEAAQDAKWRPIVRHKYTNAELLAMAEKDGAAFAR